MAGRIGIMLGLDADGVVVPRIGQIRAVCDRIGTPEKPSSCHKRFYVNVWTGMATLRGQLFLGRAKIRFASRAGVISTLSSKTMP
jgi:hypothetical protein